MFETEGHGEAALKDGKHVLAGKASVTLAINQRKYGDEAIIQLYAPVGAIDSKVRVATNYDRIQIFFKKDDFMDICRRLVKDFP